MTTGYNIVIGGREFEPNAALFATALVPCVICEKGDDGYSAEYGRGAFVEFSDFHEGAYPLDMMTEAMSFIRANLKDLYTVSHFESVEYRSLNLVDTSETVGLYILDSNELALLAALKIALNINVQKIEQDGSPNDPQRGSFRGVQD